MPERRVAAISVERKGHDPRDRACPGLETADPVDPAQVRVVLDPMADLPHDCSRRRWVAQQPRGFPESEKVLVLAQLPGQLDIAEALRAPIRYVRGKPTAP